MQKQLITDQLIEEYQKELDSIYELLTLLEMEGKNVDDHKRLSIQRNQLRIFITRLQSLRQQEVQNVIDAYHTARIDSISHDWYPEKHAKEYFTQTFEQKGGGNDELRKP